MSAIIIISFIVTIIIFVLIKINKNSLEIYNWLALILIVKTALVPYMFFTYEQNTDLSIIIINSSLVFVLTFL